MTCIYNLHRQKTFKTYEMYVYTIYTDKRHLIYENKHFATLD